MTTDFTDREAEYIETHAHERITAYRFDINRHRDREDFDNRPQIESNIRRGPASPDAILDRLQELNDSIRLAEAFYCDVEDQPAGQIKWEQSCLLVLRNEMERTARLLERWSSPTVGADLEEALSPLWSDLDAFDRWGGIPTPSHPPDEYADVPADEYSEAVDELDARVHALTRLLEDRLGQTEGEWADDERLHVILNYISEHEDDRTAELEGGRQWRTSRQLKENPSLHSDSGHLGLVRDCETWFGWELTERGEVVLEAFDNLMGTPAFGSLDEKGRADTALKAVEHLFDFTPIQGE